MLLRALSIQKPLLYRLTAGIIIYLRDHNKLINPQNSKINVSYCNPKNIVPEAPSQPFIEYKLDPEMQELLDRQIFEEYKNKLLRGIIDEEKAKEPDPLWGQDPVPVHYFAQTSKLDLMRVSQPQNNDARPILDAYFQSHFASNLSGQISKQTISTKDVHELVEISLSARCQGIHDREIWYKIQQGFQRGHKLYLLSAQELVKLKWAFDGRIKFGTPIFHDILSSLLRQDLPKMSKQLLFDLFYACGHSNPGKTNLQTEVLEALKPMFRKLSFEEKSIFLLGFSLLTKSLKYYAKVQKRRRYEFKQLAASVILELDFWDLPLTHQTTAQLVFALAKLHLPNTKFITFPLRDYITENMDTYCEDLSRLFQAIVYLPQLQAGEGVMDQQLAGKLRQFAQSRWDQFSKVEQMRIVHSLWNLGLMDEALLDMYKGIELEADSTLLYYASQIELHTSSEREWQIIQCTAHIEHIPLPYFVAYKRFYNYIKSTTKWNLTPVADKLRNTEYYFNVMRQYDSLLTVKPYRALRQFEQFSEVSFASKGAPIENLELAHFGFPLHKVSLDIVTKKEFVPGTSILKETYMNKVRSLKNIGWKHLTFTEEQLRERTLAEVIANIQNCYTPYIEEQQAIIDYDDYLLGNRLEHQRRIEAMKSWDLQDINSFMSKLKGQEVIRLGDSAVDPLDEEMHKDQSFQKELAASKGEEARKKKKK